MAAFGATRRPGISCDKDANLLALINSGAPVITIFGKSWDLHATEIMDNTLEENLGMIRESVAYLLNQGREVMYDAEHFFDGYKSNRQYALDTLEAALDGGTQTLVLCDTNGGSLPCEIEEIVRSVATYFNDRPGICYGIHTHNDCAMAVANAVNAVHVGPLWFRAPSTGTVNGAATRTSPPSFRSWR